jgi:FkbM family methyltransferase
MGPALSVLRRFFRSTPIEWPLKRSFIYRLYLRCKAPENLHRIKQDTKFYRSLIAGTHSPLVFDIGANRGEKTQVFLDLGASVVCVDPEPGCAELLKRRFAAYGGRVRVVRAALSAQSGDATMYIHAHQSGYNTLEPQWAETFSRSTGKAPDSITVATRTFDSLINEFGRPDFAKIDVEGYEDKVLSGLHQPVPLLTFEVNLPDFAEQGSACIRKLAGINDSARFNYFVSCAAGEALTQSLPAKDFVEIFSTLRETSIEIVCRMKN